MEEYLPEDCILDPFALSSLEAGNPEERVEEYLPEDCILDSMG